MSRIHPNNPVTQRKLTQEQPKQKTPPTPNWVKARLDALDGGSHRLRESMKDRIDGIPSDISNRTLTDLFLKKHPRSA